jgi:Mg2+-importing ATPase
MRKARTSPRLESNHMTAPTNWERSMEDLFATLNSSADGLTSQEAEERLAEMGANSLEARKESSPLGLFLNQFKSPIVLILLTATIISAFVHDWVDALIILVIILGSAILSFSQEYSASYAAEKLRLQVSLKTRVVRDGEGQTVLAKEIVPGDVVLLSAGSLIPADGVLLEARDFFVDQAILTGETFPVEKTPGIVPSVAGLPDRTNCVFMGTSVRSGSGKALIVQTGSRTTFGQIANRLALRPPETEFERGIRKLGYLLAEVMFVLVLSIFFFNVIFHKPILDSLLFSIALAVGLTPQLLPAIININLARGSQTMAAAGVIVRRLAAIENFGSMDILCTDKTGTLTMGVVKLDGAMDVNGAASTPVLHAAWLNAHFQTGIVNPMDEAILQGGGFEFRDDQKVDEIPYDFVRKRLSVVVRENPIPLAGKIPGRLLITKGAFENILAICETLEAGGQIQSLDQARRNVLHQLYAGWSAQGYRVLGVAVRDVQEKNRYEPGDEKAMTFLGFLLFFDPPKPDVKETITRLEELGVNLKIITGDNRLVASHTAQVIGLPAAVVMTGMELDELHDEALWHAAEKTNIFAEVDPNQKERIILALKKTGHVVGYMGDGINDAPSLHSADVGISVENAVDVAKEAADFILLKQDLRVLEQGILQGRKTFANTLKYVFMATSANFGNMFSVAGASLFLPFLPMLPKQILLINSLTDLPEMTIAGDQVDDVFVLRPHRWDVGFIRRFMLIFGTLSSLFDYATFALLLWVLKASPDVFHTAWFIESVLSAAIVVFAIRTRLPFTRSRPSRAMLAVTGIVALVTLILPYTPLAGLLGFTPLPPLYLGMILAIVAIYFISAEFTKRWFYQQVKNHG